MPDSQKEDRVAGLEALHAPERSEIERRWARERILTIAQPLLARRRRTRSYLDVLAGWARPGLIAAGIILAALIGALQLQSRTDTADYPLEGVLTAGARPGEVPALLLAVREPNADAVVEAALAAGNPNSGDTR